MLEKGLKLALVLQYSELTVRSRFKKYCLSIFHAIDSVELASYCAREVFDGRDEAKSSASTN